MKKLFLYIILIINFQSFSNANNISDFEIEGMSVGDSLLKFFSEKKNKRRCACQRI